MADEQITGFEDGAHPWAIQVVVRNERADTRSAVDLVTTVARGVITLRHQAVLDPVGAAGVAFASFEAGRIRKIVRHARGGKWEQASAHADLVLATNGVEVAVFAPGPMDMVAPLISKMQMQGLDADTSDIPTARDTPVDAPAALVSIAVSPVVTMSAAKTAVQVAHGAHIASMQMPADLYQMWAESGFDIDVTWPDRAVWDAIVAASSAHVRDAGFTEVAPMSLTVTATW